MAGPRFHYGGARVDRIKANMARIRKERAKRVDEAASEEARKAREKQTREK